MCSFILPSLPCLFCKIRNCSPFFKVFFFFPSFIFYESLNVFLLFKSSFAQCGFEATLQQNVYISVSGKMILVCSEMDYLQ